MKPYAYSIYLSSYLFFCTYHMNKIKHLYPFAYNGRNILKIMVMVIPQKVWCVPVFGLMNLN